MTNSISGERESAFGSAYKYKFLGKKNKNGQEANKQDQNTPQSGDENPTADDKTNKSKRRGSILNALI